MPDPAPVTSAQALPGATAPRRPTLRPLPETAAVCSPHGVIASRFITAGV